MDPESIGTPYDEPASDEQLQGGQAKAGVKKPTFFSILKRLTLEMIEMNRRPDEVSPMPPSETT